MEVHDDEACCSSRCPPWPHWCCLLAPARVLDPLTERHLAQAPLRPPLAPQVRPEAACARRRATADDLRRLRRGDRCATARGRRARRRAGLVATVRLRWSLRGDRATCLDVCATTSNVSLANLVVLVAILEQRHWPSRSWRPSVRHPAVRRPGHGPAGAAARVQRRAVRVVRGGSPGSTYAVLTSPDRDAVPGRPPRSRRSRVASVVYVVVNNLLVGVVVALASGEPVRSALSLRAPGRVVAGAVRRDRDPRGRPAPGRGARPAAAGAARAAGLRGARGALVAFQRTDEAYDRLVRSFVTAIEVKDLYTRGHSERVATLSVHVAEELGVPYDERRLTGYAALLHDVGKIGVPLCVINKPGPLDDDEFAQIKQHPTIGADILRDIDFLDPVLDIVRFHHERLDGTRLPPRRRRGRARRPRPHRHDRRRVRRHDLDAVLPSGPRGRRGASPSSAGAPGRQFDSRHGRGPRRRGRPPRLATDHRVRLDLGAARRDDPGRDDLRAHHPGRTRRAPTSRPPPIRWRPRERPHPPLHAGSGGHRRRVARVDVRRGRRPAGAGLPAGAASCSRSAITELLPIRPPRGRPVPTSTAIIATGALIGVDALRPGTPRRRSGGRWRGSSTAVPAPSPTCWSASRRRGCSAASRRTAAPSVPRGRARRAARSSCTWCPPRSIVAVLVAVLPALEVLGLGDRTRFPLRRIADEIRATWSADAAIAATAVLGALVHRSLGPWTLPSVLVPLLAARIGLERFAGVTTAYDQTIRAMSRLPEQLGTITPEHGVRVGQLARAVSSELGMDAVTVVDIERAAYLHELGHIRLEPEDRPDQTRTRRGRREGHLLRRRPRPRRRHRRGARRHRGAADRPGGRSPDRPASSRPAARSSGTPPT